MATIKEIAALAGVSPAAVSRVLNMDRSFSASAETRARILAAADELQYQRSGRGRRYLAKAVLAVLHEEAEELDDPYYLNVRLHVRKAAETARIRLSEQFCPAGPEGLRVPEDCAGLLVLGESSRWDARWREAAAAWGLPAVLVDFAADDRAADCVCADPRQIVETALAHFEEKGIARVGYIGASASAGEPVPDQRQICFEQDRKVRGRFRPEDVHTASEATFEGGYRLAREILAGGDLPRAFFAMNDSMAIGACRAFKEAGLRIPEDLEMIGCNNISAAAYHTPPLTTVDLHPDLIGELSVRVLKDRIEHGGERELGVRVIVPCELVVRGSTRER